MNYNLELRYNQDFEWHETKVLVGKERINLFVSGCVESDLSELDERFASIKSWLKQNRTMVDTLCSKKLSALHYGNGENSI